MNIALAIVEDRTVRESLRAALPQSDLLLFESSVGGALRRLVSIQADVVLLDDGPRLGIKALPELLDGMPAATHNAAHPPVVVLTARDDNETRGAYLAAGAARCIAKPFNVEELKQAVQGLAEPETAPPLPLATPGPAHSAALGQHQMALRWMSRNTACLEDPAKLCESLVEAVIDIFDAASAAVLLHCDGAFRVKASEGVNDTIAKEIRLSSLSGMMRRFEARPGMLEAGSANEDPAALKELSVFGGRFALPLMASGRICGALIAGDKITGGTYQPEERELLAVMVRCTSACLDKTRRYREISRQQQRVDAVLSNLQAGVVTVDPEGRITMLNESAEQILQLKAATLLGRRVQKLGSAFADVVLRSIDANAPLLRQEIRDPAINAQLGLSVTPLGTEGAVALFSKLPTESEKPPEDAGPDLEASPIWEYLSSRVAQEIKNPMVAISTFAQLLPTRYDSADFRDEFSSVVQSEVQRINGVVELLYNFARKPRLTLQQADLNGTVRQVLDGLQDELDACTIDLELDFASAALEVRQDSLLLAQAIHNLVSNAIEAMPHGGTLSIQTRAGNEQCEVLFRDTGPGIAKDDAARIFKPFFSTKETGMGLGLTMAQRIVRQHGGTLDYLNEGESGGAFRLTLPSAMTPIAASTTAT